MLLKRLLAYILFFVAIQTLAAQNAIVYKDASEFPFYGRIHNEQNNLYGRLPLSFEEVSRSSVWRLGRNSAGSKGAVLFLDCSQYQLAVFNKNILCI